MIIPGLEEPEVEYSISSGEICTTRFSRFEMCKCESSILPARDMTSGIHSSPASPASAPEAPEVERSRSPPGGRRGMRHERGESAWT